MMNGEQVQEIRKEVVKALGEAAKSSLTHVASAAITELQKIEAKVFAE